MQLSKERLQETRYFNEWQIYKAMSKIQTTQKKIKNNEDFLMLGHYCAIKMPKTIKLP